MCVYVVLAWLGSNWNDGMISTESHPLGHCPGSRQESNHSIGSLRAPVGNPKNLEEVFDINKSLLVPKNDKVRGVENMMEQHRTFD